MRLYIMRHAPAVPRGTPGDVLDSRRPLTPEGLEVSRSVGRALRRLRVKPDMVLTSPYARAVQTAQTVAKCLGKKVPVRECAELKAEATPQQTSRALRDLAEGSQNIFLVGHEPHLSRWISELLTGTTDLACVMKKGSVACLDFPLGMMTRGRLKWLLAPKQISSLSQSERPSRQ